MSPVFAHGSLRLYLLVLLADHPMHGYEVIQALGDRFGGTYVPSAGTVYPRLAKLEAEGLVTATTDGPTSGSTPSVDAPFPGGTAPGGMAPGTAGGATDPEEAGK